MGPILTVHLKSIDHNIAYYRRILGTTKICAVVKANAYGFGLVDIATHVQEKVDYLAVARVEEAVTLRQNGISIPILIMGYVAPSEFESVVEHDLTATIKSQDVAKTLSTEARRKEKVAKVHVKVDTGMNRIGLEPENVLYFVKKILDYPNLAVEGLFSHLAAAWDAEFSHKQLGRYKGVVEELMSEKIEIPLKHICASRGALLYPDYRYDMVRVGGGMYGFPIDPELQFSADLTTRLTNVQLVKGGEYVGYDFGFRTKEDTLIGTLALGYGDGFRRTPFNNRFVLIRGKRCPIAGFVAMDQTMVDLTAVPDAQVGDSVVLVGTQNQETILPVDVSDALQTNAYEPFTSLSPRVRRDYT